MGLPDRSQFKNEKIATLRFVFVLGKLGPSGEPLWMLPLGFYLLKEGSPGFIELDQHFITDFARQSFIGIRGLDQIIDRSVVEIRVLENERLAHIVVGQVPEVFGGKGQGVNTLEAWVARAEHMLLHQL